jgi:hypothetical protein
MENKLYFGNVLLLLLLLLLLRSPCTQEEMRM